MPGKALNIEYKSFHFELKAVNEDQGIIEGYLSTFGNVDSQKDRVVKGAFKKTLLEAKSRMQSRSKKYLWPVLWMHEPEKPLGGCLDAYEDDKGLYTKFQLDISTNAQGIPNNPLATMVFSGYKNGYIDEQSMGYKAIQKDYDNEGVRNLKECQVWEESCVTSLFAANEEAIATGVKAFKQDGQVNKSMQTKDFNDRYREQCLADWVGMDFTNLTTALKQSLMDIFNIGDTPEVDLVDTILQDNDASQGFITALKAWVAKGIELNASNYLNNTSTSDNIRYYMTRGDNDMDTKAGASFSQANKDAIQSKADQLKAIAMQHKMLQQSMNDTATALSNDGYTQHAENVKDMANVHGMMHKAITDVAGDLNNIIGNSPFVDPDGNAPSYTPEPTKSLEPRTALKTAQEVQPLNSTGDAELDLLAQWLKQQTGNPVGVA